ncbi:MAG: hypothetical protein OEZ06_21225 [Myxococcales bacterium]|nr:hypothetical protein [Myxococcales bacterium]
MTKIETKLTALVLTTLACSLPLTGGCGERGEWVDERPELLGGPVAPVALGETLVLVEASKHSALLMQPDSDNDPKVVELPHGPIQMLLRNGAPEALVLSQGLRANAEEKAEPAALTALDADGKTRIYELGNPFNRLSQSDDGRYAFLYKSNLSERLLDNPNEVAVIDLDASPDGGGAISLRTLRSFGDSPERIVFSPTMTIVGEERRLSLVLSQTNVTLLDLDHLDRRETTVQLSGSGGPLVQPSQVVFSETEPVLYVRGEGSDDVFVFNLAERPGGSAAVDEEGEHNDFRPFINQLGVGSDPSDMALYESADGPRLLVVAAGSQQIAIVEADTSQVTQIPLPARARNLLLFEGTSPRDDRVAQRALLYESGNPTVTFLDLEDAEQEKSRNLDTLRLDAPFDRLIPMLDEGMVLVVHDGSGISLIDLADRTVSPIRSSQQLNDAFVDRARRKLWVGPQGQPRIGSLAFDTGETDELLLDAPVRSLVPMLDAGRLAVVHENAAGHITWIDADNPVRESATSVRGFLFTDLFDREDP